MVGMTATTLDKTGRAHVAAGQGGNSGRFTFKTNTEDTISLEIGFGDTIRPATAEESRAVVEKGLALIDRSWVDIESAADDIEDATASGRAHAAAEVLAIWISDDGAPGEDYESFGEELLNSRREGISIEAQDAGWPGPMTALKRQFVVDHCRQRADEMFRYADDATLPADVQAFFAARFETFSEFGIELSGSGE